MSFVRAKVACPVHEASIHGMLGMLADLRIDATLWHRGLLDKMLADLLAAAAMADDRIALTNGTSPLDNVPIRNIAAGQSGIMLLESMGIPRQ